MLSKREMEIEREEIPECLMIIVICGSVNKNGRYMEYWRKVFKKHFKKATIIYPFNAPYPDTHDPIEKYKNRKYYFGCLEQSTDVIICNDIDYIGFETACELGYALCKNRNIYFTNLDSEIDGVKALIKDGTANKDSHINNIIKYSIRYPLGVYREE